MQQRSRSPRTELELGCIFPIAGAVVVLVAIGVLIGSHLAAPPTEPRQVAVRVIDDGAPGGPALLATAVVPLR